MAEELKAQGSLDANARAMKFEDTNTRRDLERIDGKDVQDRTKRQEDDVWKELEDDMTSWDLEKRRTVTKDKGTGLV